SELGPVQTGKPPAGRRGGWESESLRVFNARQESGNGTRELRTGSRSVPQYGTRIRDWVPARPGRYMLGLSKDRERRTQWQHAAVAQADVAEVSKQVELALFFDAKLDVAAMA